MGTTTIIINELDTGVRTNFNKKLHTQKWNIKNDLMKLPVNKKLHH